MGDGREVGHMKKMNPQYRLREFEGEGPSPARRSAYHLMVSLSFPAAIFFLN